MSDTVVRADMSIATARRHMARFMKRTGADAEPIPLPELDGLHLPVMLTGEVSPVRPTSPSVLYYGPNGEPLEGALDEIMMHVWRQREQWRSQTLYRAGSRLRVITTYLGLDVSLGMSVPTVWETMIFHGGQGLQLGAGEQCWRYATRAAARAGHVAVVTALVEAQRARRNALVASNRPGKR